MQAWSDEGETMRGSVEKIHKFDSCRLSSLYQVLRRTTANEPLRIVQETEGQKGFQTWRPTVRSTIREHVWQKNQHMQH